MRRQGGVWRATGNAASCVFLGQRGQRQLHSRSDPLGGMSSSQKGSTRGHSEASRSSPHGGRDSFSSSSFSPTSLPLSPKALKEDETFGLFQNTHINAFPIRAAIDIGTGGVISLCIGRVDAEKAAITKLMYATQLPLYLEAATGASDHQHGGNPSFALSEKTIVDIRNKMRMLTGAMRRDTYEGLNERAAILSHPLCLADNAVQLAEELTKEFKVNVLVLGKSFNVAWPGALPATLHEQSADLHNAPADESTTGQRGEPEALSVAEKMLLAKRKKGKKGSLRKLLQEYCNKTREEREGDDTTPKESRSTSSALNATGVSLSTDAQLQQLAFLAHAASAQCVAPQRLLALVEDPHKGLLLVGADTSAEADVQDLLVGPDGQLVSADEQERIMRVAGITPTQAARDGGEGGLREKEANPPLSPQVHHSGSGIRLLEHRLAIDAAEAHRLCITDIQRRPAASYGLHVSSPNPLLREEWVALRNAMVDILSPTLPSWVRRKADLGGVIAGTSVNGGVLNLAARVAQRAPISLEHLEVNAQFHFCGLTDTLLAATFPNPLLVLTSAALGAAVMRALQTPRVSYLPELSTAAALLVQPALWTYENRQTIRAGLKKEAFFTDPKQRTFARPHRKDNPTASPNAQSVRNGKWNDMSFESSMRGT